jgi:hypothetical protein
LRFSARPDHAAGRRHRLPLALAAVLVAGLVPAYLLLAPPSRWSPLTLLVTLACLVLINFVAMVTIRANAALNAEFVAVLLAVAFLGALPAACIWIAAEATLFALKRYRIEALLANAASYGWATLVGSLVLNGLASAPLSSGAHPAAYLAVALVAIVMLCVNFAVTRGIVGVLVDRMNVAATVRRELLGPAPATLLMVLLGTATAYLYARIGIPALGLFAATAVTPQILLPLLLRPRPVSELEHSQAVALYAQAIGQVMKLSRDERLVLRDAAAFMRERQLRPRSGELSGFSDGHRLALVEAVLFHREHWDGHNGVPGAVGGEMIPLSSRILAVADGWSGLTAKDSPRLSHAQALNQLGARAGMHFDPRVVEAARIVIEREWLGLPADAAYQPSLHRLPLPRLARRLRARAWGWSAAGSSA